MATINKVYPGFPNGISEQVDELILDTQCRDMVNMVPSIVSPTRRRNGTTSVIDLAEVSLAQEKFHQYDRGEGGEQYNFYKSSNASNPLRIFDKNGIEKTVNYVDVVATNAYLSTVDNLKALTVQDRTFLLSKDKEIGQTTVIAEDVNYDKRAFYWAKRSSNDSSNPYRYAVYINNKTFQTVDHESDTAVSELSDLINQQYALDPTVIPDYIRAVAIGSVLQIYMTPIHAPGFRTYTGYTDDTLVTPKTSTNKFVRVRSPEGTIEGKDVTEYQVSFDLIEGGYELWCDVGGVVGWYNLVDEAPTTIGVPYYNNANSAVNNTSGDFVYMELFSQDLSTVDFTFSSWDSWGSQASEGWKGDINKLSDLPSDMPFDSVYVHVTGNDTNDFNDYYVKWTGKTWTEWKDPKDTRGVLTNMPIRVDRLADGTFEVDVLEWEAPKVGDSNTNSDPTFFGSTIEDLYFYKNRLGFASGDSLILSETGGYYNFYIKTVLNVLDTDPIDIAIASNKASRIYHVKPFQRGLYIFTSDAQFELVSEGALSPLTVSIDPVSNYEMDTNVEPVVAGTSLYFISKTRTGQAQVREYLKDEDSLVSKGVDTTLAVPSLLPDIKEMYISATLGFLFCIPLVESDTIYIYKTESSGTERVQSAWFKFKFGFTVKGIYLFDTSLYVMKEASGSTNILELPIFPVDGNKEDIVDSLSTAQSFESKITLPRFMPQFGNLRNPLDNVQVKAILIEADGSFNVDIYRKGYNTTYTRTFASGSTKNNRATVLGRSDDIEVSLKNDGVSDLELSSLTIIGSYRQSSKEVK